MIDEGKYTLETIIGEFLSLTEVENENVPSLMPRFERLIFDAEICSRALMLLESYVSYGFDVNLKSIKPSTNPIVYFANNCVKVETKTVKTKIQLERLGRQK
jgi:hypothetical protein